jgi:hypothetical protein
MKFRRRERIEGAGAVVRHRECKSAAVNRPLFLFQGNRYFLKRSSKAWRASLGRAAVVAMGDFAA